MDLRKFFVIAFKDVRQLFADRAGLLTTFAAPLVLTFVIGAAFSGFSGRDGPIKDIPVVVVNQDKGATFGPQPVNFGQNLLDALKSTGSLLKADALTDENEAKALVRQGKASAAVL